MEVGLVFGQKLNNKLLRELLLYSLIGFADNNFVGDPRDCKSVIGYCFFFNKVVVSWYSKKQRIVSTSITEIEYIALGYTIRENVLIRQFINEMKLKVVESITLHGDNEMNIALIKNAESQHCTKHIDMHHHYT